MKYLSLYLDGPWSFGPRFRHLVSRLERAAACIFRLMPSLGRLDEWARRLNEEVVRSMALYKTPIWADALIASRRNRKALRRMQRRLAIRVIRGYRTVSHEAAAALAGVPSRRYGTGFMARSHEKVIFENKDAS
ncbi:hypothetical protein WH47_06863 [Habropoda laboriosa]|uniref:Uncharacterized protein n=1 Tax=Habropoda laboriosa TaxID=597456 RepID=A0A0L7QIZ6_9HYME|nr:hypothetical protein WH47_06863 [Habropoda laboriosa]